MEPTGREVRRGAEHADPPRTTGTAAMELDQRQTLILAILVLSFGRWLNRRVAPLRDWNIPEPVTGGLVASLLLGAAFFAFRLKVTFTMDARDMLLIVFFTTIGLSSNVRMLAAGGWMLVMLTVVAAANNVMQNLVGVGVAWLLGAPPGVGLLAGSAALAGGHGTVIAWAPTIGGALGVANATEVGTAAATFGLIAGGVLGGPLAHRLITRHRLVATAGPALTVGSAYSEESRLKLDATGVLNAILVIAIAIGLGGRLNELLADWGLKLPQFVTALFAGIVLSNTVPHLLPKLHWPTGSPSLALVADIALGLFLSMSLMSLQLWTLLEMAGPLLAILAAQIAACWLLMGWLVFRLLGRSYDAAVASSGFFGLALGATPTAIATMTAVTKAHGASLRSFLVVPLVGAFFVDIANSVTLQAFVTFLTR
jgi:ESS family glutamate:Na+ symporter